MHLIEKGYDTELTVDEGMLLLTVSIVITPGACYKHSIQVGRV